MPQNSRNCYFHFIASSTATVDATVAVLRAIIAKVANRPQDKSTPRVSNLSSEPKRSVLLFVNEQVQRELLNLSPNLILSSDLNRSLNLNCEQDLAIELVWLNRKGELLQPTAKSEAESSKQNPNYNFERARTRFNPDLVSDLDPDKAQDLVLTLPAKLKLELTLVSKTELNLLLGREFDDLLLEAEMLTLTALQKITPCLKQGGALHLLWRPEQLSTVESDFASDSNSLPNSTYHAKSEIDSGYTRVLTAEQTEKLASKSELNSWLELFRSALQPMANSTTSYELDFSKLSQLEATKLEQLELLGFATGVGTPKAPLLSLAQISAQQQFFIAQVLQSLEQKSATKYFLLNSPRGTGKTYTLFQLIRQSLQQGKSRILFCSHSKASFAGEFARELEQDTTCLEYCSVADLSKRLASLLAEEAASQQEVGNRRARLSTLLIIDEAASQNSALLEQLLAQEEAYQALVFASTLVGYEGNSSGFSHIVLSQLSKLLLLKQQSAYLFSQPQGIRAIADAYDAFFSPASLASEEVCKTVFLNTLYRYRQPLAQRLWNQFLVSDSSVATKEESVSLQLHEFRTYCLTAIVNCFKHQQFNSELLVRSQADMSLDNTTVAWIKLAGIFSEQDFPALQAIVTKLIASLNLNLSASYQANLQGEEITDKAQHSPLVVRKIKASEGRKLLAFQQVALRNHYNVKLESPQLYQLDYYQLYALEPEAVALQNLSHPQIQGGIVLIREQLKHSLELKGEIIAGNRLPPGNLSVQQLISQYGLLDYANLKVTRISRIFLDPAWRGQHQSEYFLAAMERQEQQAKAPDLWTTSFGYHPKLLKFWLGQNFVPVALTRKLNKNSGRFNLLAIKATAKSAELVADLGNKFCFTLLVRHLSSLKGELTDLSKSAELAKLSQPADSEGVAILTDLNFDTLLQSYLQIQELDQVTWQQELVAIQQVLEAKDFLELIQQGIKDILSADSAVSAFNPLETIIKPEVSSGQGFSTRLIGFLLQASLACLTEANQLQLLHWGLGSNLSKTGNGYFRYFDHWQNLHFSALLWQGMLSRLDPTSLVKLSKKLAASQESQASFAEQNMLAPASKLASECVTRVVSSADLEITPSPAESLLNLSNHLTSILTAYQQQVQLVVAQIKQQQGEVNTGSASLTFAKSSFAQANLKKQQRQAQLISAQTWQEYCQSLRTLLQDLGDR